MNQITLIGNVGKDAELRAMPNGRSVMSFRMATTEKWKDASGARQEHTEWWSVSAFGPGAEAVAQWVTKGTRIMVQGRGKMREYTDKSGEIRHQFEVVAETWELLGDGGKKTERAPEKTVFDQGGAGDDIPF